MITSITTAIPPKMSIICNKHIGERFKLPFGLWNHVVWLGVTDILEEHRVCIIMAKHTSVTRLMPQQGAPCINSSSAFTSNFFASPSSVPLCIPLHPYTHSFDINSRNDNICLWEALWVLCTGQRGLEKNTRIRAEFEASSAIKVTCCCGTLTYFMEQSPSWEANWFCS